MDNDTIEQKAKKCGMYVPDNGSFISMLMLGVLALVNIARALEQLAQDQEARSEL